MIMVGLIVLRVAGAVAFMMRRRIGHDDNDSLGLGPERKAGRIGERVELILGNVATAARVQRADPIGKLVHIRSEAIAILAVTIGIFGDDVIFEGHQAEPVVAIVGREVLDELDDVLFDRIDIGLHRFGDIEDKDDVDRAALPDAAEIDDLGRLAILEYFDIFGFEIADRLAVVVGQAEI